MVFCCCCDVFVMFVDHFYWLFGAVREECGMCGECRWEFFFVVEFFIGGCLCDVDGIGIEVEHRGECVVDEIWVLQ